MGVWNLHRRKKPNPCAPIMLNELVLDSARARIDALMSMDSKESAVGFSTAHDLRPSSSHQYPPSLASSSTTAFTNRTSTIFTSSSNAPLIPFTAPQLRPDHTVHSAQTPGRTNSLSVYSRWVKRIRSEEAAASAHNAAGKKRRKQIKEYLPDRDATIGGLTLTFTAIRDIGDATNIGYMKGLAGLALLIIEVTEVCSNHCGCGMNANRRCRV